MKQIKITEKTVKEFMRWNKCRDKSHAIKLMKQVNENYRTGNYFTLEDLIKRLVNQ